VQAHYGFPRVLLAGTVLALAAGCAGVSSLPRPGLVADTDWSGLEPVDIKGIDIAYVRPEANFAAYTRLLLDPIEVSFAQGWQPLRPGSSFAASEDELESLRRDTAMSLQDAFTRYMDRDRRYPVVDAPGPGVLRIRARIVDLMLNAPDIESGSRSERYARSFGEATLVAELIDAESGALVGRLIDRYVGPEDLLRRYTRVDNDLALRRAMTSWAESLQRYLNVAGFRQQMLGVREHDRRNGPP
jgi:hypothetical protein